MSPELHISKDRLDAFCRDYHIRKLSIFGSVLSGDFGPDSDVDVLVEFLPGHVPGFFKLVDMEDTLTQIFGGRKADLRTPEELSRYFRDRILKTAEVQYVHG